MEIIFRFVKTRWNKKLLEWTIDWWRQARERGSKSQIFFPCRFRWRAKIVAFYISKRDAASDSPTSFTRTWKTKIKQNRMEQAKRRKQTRMKIESNLQRRKVVCQDEWLCWKIKRKQQQECICDGRL